MVIIPYSTPNHTIDKGITSIADTKLLIFGTHKLQNLNAAKLVCNELGVSDDNFYQEIKSFSGASNRLELICKKRTPSIYKDFAHSPSKLKATILAMKEQFKNRKLVASIELHTFSSLNKDFLNQYKGSMHHADIAIIYFNTKSIKNKKLEPITKTQVHNAFGREDLLIFTESKKLTLYLKSINWNYKNLLMMSSGNFDNIKLNQLTS